MTVAFKSALTSANLNAKLISRTTDQTASGVIDFVNGMKANGVLLSKSSASLDITDASGIILPRGMVRHPSPPNGLIWYNEASGRFEGYQDGSWFVFSAAAAAYSTSWKTVLQSSSSVPGGTTSGLYLLTNGDDVQKTGVGAYHPPALIYIDSANFPAIAGVNPKFKIRAQFHCNDTAPSAFQEDWIFGLSAITRPSSSGGSGLVIYDAAAQITGTKTTTETTVAADESKSLESPEFDLPSNGFYAITLDNNITVGASSHIHVMATLDYRYAP